MSTPKITPAVVAPVVLPELSKLEIGYAKQGVSLRSTMALTDADWQRGLVCLTGENKGKCIKNPRHGWVAKYGHNWFNRAEKTRLAKTLFAAAKLPTAKDRYPTYKVGGNEYKLAMGLSVAARKKLVLLGEW